MEKIYLYKFTHVSLLKNDALLKQKSEKNNHPNLLGNKNHIQKKKSQKKKKEKGEGKRKVRTRPKKEKEKQIGVFLVTCYNGFGVSYLKK